MTSSPSHAGAALHVLAASDFFGGLGPDELAALSALLTARRCPRRAAIFHQGDPGHSLLLVEHGTVHCYMVTEEGREVTVAVVGPNDILGELAFFDGCGRSATAMALSDVKLWSLNRDDFYQYIRRSPTAAAVVLAALSERFRHTYDELRKRSFASTAARLARRLADLARVHGRAAPEGTLIATRATQAQMAELIGRSRVTVNKTLGELEASGFIRRVGHRIVVRDLAALERAAIDESGL